MKEAVLEGHLEGDPHRPLGQAPPLDPGRGERVEVGDLDPPDPLQGQHPRGGGLPVNLRDVDVGVALEGRGEALGVLPLADVIELGPQGLGELLGQPDDVVLVGQLPSGGSRSRRGSRGSPGRSPPEGRLRDVSP